jgi:DNA-binding PadR family transcriptional regulator
MHAKHIHHHHHCGPNMTGRGSRHRRHRGFGPPGPRARRGDVRAAIIALLAEEPRNGYQIIQEIGERTQGVWQPSPGAVYPSLAVLEDEGLVRANEVDGKRLFELTDEGRAHFTEHAEHIGKPWEKVTEGVPDSELALQDHLRQLVEAVVQVIKAGDEAQADEAKKVLGDARKAVYRILAGD